MKKTLITISGFSAMLMIGRLFMGSTKTSADNYPQLFENKYKTYDVELPDRFEFAGENIPMNEAGIKKRFDRELHINTYWQSQTSLLIKRAFRFFPVIRPILKRNGIPDDFKYLPLVESGFQDMVSPSGAQGPWQFLPATARLYHLHVDNEIDERYDLAKSTQAACDYFKEAYQRLGNWTLVAASYNMGISGLVTATKKQEVKNYYQLDLNTQTARYVFRLAAIKEIMEHPAHYGFQYLRRHLYQPIPTVKLRVDTSIGNLVHFARSQGISYQELRELNPWIKSYQLSNKESKTYYLYIPKDRGNYVAEKQEPEFVEDSLLKNVKLPELTLYSDTEKTIKNQKTADYVNRQTIELHMVKKGESLDRIARQYKVKAVQIKQWNSLKSNKLMPGQQLKIYEDKVGKIKE